MSLADAHACDECGAAAEPGALRLWSRYAQVRMPRTHAARLAVAEPGLVQQSPRYALALRTHRFCPDCYARAEVDEADEAASGRKVTLRLAIAAALIGAISLAGPPFWPVVVRWLHGMSPAERAMQRVANAPVSPYHADLPVPPLQATPGAPSR